MSRIPDPFLGFNELKAEWVADKTWTYKVELPQITDATEGIVHVLAFDGLDTFATVKLNGEIILKCDNMFIPHRLDVTKKLTTGHKNILEIDFVSARLEAIKIKDEHPEHKWVGFNGDMARLAVRKAQYHWGWDWGPILNTCGPWREVRLESYQARLEDLRVDYKLDDSLKSVQGTVSARVEGPSAQNVTFAVFDGDTLVFKESANISDGVAKVEFHVNNPKLWYPHGYGKQPLYKITATVLADGAEVHEASRRTGFRKGELIQEPDAVGKTFYFRINGVDVFCGGSDWIPADSFTPRVTEEKYRRWLEMMVDGYQLMIRYALWVSAHVMYRILLLTRIQDMGRRHLGRGCILRYLRRAWRTCLARLHVRLRQLSRIPKDIAVNQGGVCRERQPVATSSLGRNLCWQQRRLPGPGIFWVDVQL